MDFLEFTLELEEDFDTKIYIVDGRIIFYEIYQKPMSSNLVLQAGSALSFPVKVAYWKEEVVRRLKHTSTRLEHTKWIETLEDLSQRMRNSGQKTNFINNDWRNIKV